MNVVAYARFSSENQREESIDAQIRAIKYYANQYGHDIVGIYSDKAKSGRTTDRPQFMQMIRDSEKGEFEAVIVHKLDRFSRDSTDTAYYERKLKINGVELISVNERLDKTPEGFLMKQIIIGMNQFYSANLAREVMKGLKENAYNCLFTGGITPLGYDVGEDKKYIINEQEARTVRIIFDMYAKGHGYNEIVNILNAQSLKTKLGKPFGKNSLHEILKNEKYIGTYLYNQRASKDIRGKSNRHKFKSENEIIRIENAIPAIIEKGVFEKVQKIMDENRKSGARYKAKETYLLSGKLVCGACRNIMTGERRKSGETYIRYYICNYRKRTGQCTQKAVRADLIEERVIENLNRKIFNKKNIDDICKRIYESYQTNDIDEKVNEYKREISGITTRINNLYKAIESGLNAEETMKRINTLTDERNALEVKIMEMKVIPAENKSVEEIKKLFSATADLHKLSPENQKLVIQKSVDKIYLYEKGDKKIVRVVVNPNNIDVSTFLDIDGRGCPLPTITKITYLHGVLLLDFVLQK